jgi:hypothetical protein
MTGAQKSYLKTLSEEAKAEFNETLTKAQASERIDELQRATGRGKDARRQAQPADIRSDLLRRDSLCPGSMAVGLTEILSETSLAGPECADDRSLPEFAMKSKHRLGVAALLVAGGGLALHVALAQVPGIWRTGLQRHDLATPGRELIQVRVDFAPGALAPGHSHPGEEIVYVIGGVHGVPARGQAGHAQDRRSLVYPRRNDPLGEERRQRRLGRARYLRGRKGQAAGRVGGVRRSDKHLPCVFACMKSG